MQHDAQASWRILVADVSLPSQSLSLQNGALLIGASSGCAIRSGAPGVAPRHAELLAGAEGLRLRIFESTPSVLLNGTDVHGIVPVPSPATIQIGSLKISIEHAAPAQHAGPDSTLRIAHPEPGQFLQFAKGDIPEVTGRIVRHFPGSGTPEFEGVFRESPQREPSGPGESFLEERTMAFATESVGLSNTDRVAVRADYEVRSEIARGGMGQVYSAQDAELSRLVALKVSTAADRSKDSQFFREARVLADLAHPNIVPIHNLGFDADGRPFYTMKLIQGHTLQWIIKQLAAGDLLTASVYTRGRLLDVLRKVCDAVSFAHSKGYLHRDLKPENIMVGEFGEVLVMDWGLAKVIRRSGAVAANGVPDDGEPESLPYIEGTPQYMSPEQANGVYGGLDERSDIYSLGGILYAILTLRPPVIGASLDEVLEKVRNGETTTMALRPGALKTGNPMQVMPVPEALRAVTHKAMARERELRYPSVGAFAADLEAYQNGFATSAEKAGGLRQLVLLVNRNRIAAGFAAALFAGAVVFTLRLAISEKRALENEQRAVLNARTALAEKETARKSAAQAQTALAAAAAQGLNAQATRTALETVDNDLRGQTWRYLKHACDSAAATHEIHRADWLAFVPHPRQSGVLVVLHADGILRTIDLDSGVARDLCKIADAKGLRLVNGLAISSNGKTAAVTALSPASGGPGKAARQVHLVQIQSGKRIPLPESPALTGIHDMAFSPNGRLLMARASNGQATVFDSESGALLWSRTEGWFDLHRFQETGTCRCIKSSRMAVELDPLTGLDRVAVSKSPLSIPLPHGFLSDASSDRLLYLFNGSVRKIDLLTGQVLFENRAFSTDWRIIQVSYVDDDRLMVSLSPTLGDTAILQVWDGQQGTLLRSIPIEIPGGGKEDWRLLTGPGWRHVAVLRGTTIKTWPMQSVRADFFQPVDPHITHGFSFGSSSGSIVYQKPRTMQPDGRFAAELAVVSPDGLDARRTPLLDGIVNPVSFLSSNRTGTRLAFGAASSVYAPTSLRLFQDLEGSRMQQPGGASPIAGAHYCFELSPEGDLLWLGTGFHDPSTGSLVHPLDRSGVAWPEWVESACWVGNARVAETVTLLKENTYRVRAIALWSLGNAKPLVLEAPEAKAVSASPDGTLIAEAGADRHVHIRDGTTLAELKLLRVHDAPVTGVAWHPTLPLLATASEDYTVKIWNLETESLVEELGIFQAAPAKLYWSPDGRRLAVRITAGISLFTPNSCAPGAR